MDLTQYLDDLYYLVCVIDAGGFSAAARELGTTRSLLSRHIIALESKLGTTLLARDARHFAVTQTGERVYQQAVLMCDAARAAVVQATASDNGHSGTLRIGTSTFLPPLMARLLTAFGGAHPDVCVQTRSGDSQTLLDDASDIALHLGHRLPRSSAIVAHRLGELRLVTVGSPKLLDQIDAPLYPNKIEGNDRLVYTGHGLADGWVLRGGHATATDTPRMSSDQLAPILHATRAGIGFAQLPWLTCRDDIEAGRLVTVLEDFDPLPMPIYALTRSAGMATGLSSGFIDFARNYLQSPAAAAAALA